MGKLRSNVVFHSNNKYYQILNKSNYGEVCKEVMGNG